MSALVSWLIASCLSWDWRHGVNWPLILLTLHGHLKFFSREEGVSDSYLFNDCAEHELSMRFCRWNATDLINLFSTLLFEVKS